MSQKSRSNIEKYNNFTGQARTIEQSEKPDWAFAARLWRMAGEIATNMHWQAKAAWCENRAEFCEMALKRAKKRAVAQ